MKEKFLAALKLKFPGASDKTLDRIATKKAGTVTDENQIDTIVESITFDTLVESETDSRIAESNKKANQNILTAAKAAGMEYTDGKFIPVQTQKQQDPKTGDDTPEWAKALIKQNEELSQRVAGFETKTKQQTAAEKLRARLGERKIPETFMKGRVINDESEVDTVFAEIDQTYTEIRQQIVNESVPESVPGGGLKITGKKQVEAAIDSWRKDKTPISSETKN